MDDRSGPASATEQHRFVSDGLGLLPFPVGTVESHDIGDHVMGVVIIGWLTRHPLERWGPRWAESGAMQLRFHSHLSTGLPLITSIDRSPDGMAFGIGDSDGALYATGTASPPGAEALPPPAQSHRAPGSGQVRPARDELADLVLTPLTFEFEADRDLAFTEGIDDGAFWRDRRWAHPAWLASATNAMVRHNIDFGTPGRWANAGVSVRQHAPIADAATITLTGRIDELFDRTRHRFATAAITVLVDDEPRASLRNTFVYERIDQSTAPADREQ